MSTFLKQMINTKIKKLHTNELLEYAIQYGFNLSTEEADQILTYIQKHEVDLFSKSEIEKFHQELSSITNVKTANEAKALFEKMIKTYNLGHLFN